jgi:hypothetical protein
VHHHGLGAKDARAYIGAPSLTSPPECCG